MIFCIYCRSIYRLFSRKRLTVLCVCWSVERSFVLEVRLNELFFSCGIWAIKRVLNALVQCKSGIKTYTTTKLEIYASLDHLLNLNLDQNRVECDCQCSVGRYESQSRPIVVRIVSFCMLFWLIIWYITHQILIACWVYWIQKDLRQLMI
jgi:hypothetical protein